MEEMVAPDEPAAAEPIKFVPNAFQRGILEALKGKALRTDELARRVGDRRRLFRPTGGLSELQDEGLVKHTRRVGYYRPDEPPPEVSDEPEERE